jgi:hypothetical protein
LYLIDECFHESNPFVAVTCSTNCIAPAQQGVYDQRFPLFRLLLSRNPYNNRKSKIINNKFSLRYPFIGESAGLVQHQHHIYVRHQFMLINPGYALMSSMTFGGSLAGLGGRAAAERHKNQNQ